METAEMLTVSDLMHLTGFCKSYIMKLAQTKVIKSEKGLNAYNRPKYLFNIKDLDLSLQKKYYAEKKAEAKYKEIGAVEEKPLEMYSRAEREEIAEWEKILKEWQDYRIKKSDKNYAESDNEYVAYCKVAYPNKEISVATLYRMLRSVRAKNLDGLVDKRGKYKKGSTSIQKPMWDTFLFYFLDEAQHPVSQCYNYMKNSLKETNPELLEIVPSITSFRRYLEDNLPEKTRILGREGYKAYRDAAGFYIRREYENMEANDYWIGDTHTFDIQSADDDGSIHRLYLSAFMDARSAVLVGWAINTAPSSQTTLMALRDAILKRNCVPKNIYVDNGREFLTHDVGGLGHRKKKPKDGVEKFEPPPVFERMGIKMTNAIVRNARAKTIERRFCDFKNQISRLFPTYTGGNVVERPEILKARIKNGEVVLDKTLKEQINEMIEYYFNYEEYGGSVVADKGKKKIDVYNEQTKYVRKPINVDNLNLMLMRSSRVQTVGRRGVHLKINGEMLDYSCPELKDTMFGKKVYYRYDPDNLASIRVYDLEDKFIMTVPCCDETVLSYGASKEEIKAAQQYIRAEERSDKDKLAEIRALGYKPVRELVLAQTMENKLNPAKPANPKTIELIRVAEEQQYKTAVGFVDIGRMNRNAERKLKENEG